MSFHLFPPENDMTKSTILQYQTVCIQLTFYKTIGEHDLFQTVLVAVNCGITFQIRKQSVSVDWQMFFRLNSMSIKPITVDYLNHTFLTYQNLSICRSKHKRVRDSIVFNLKIDGNEHSQCLIWFQRYWIVLYFAHNLIVWRGNSRQKTPCQWLSESISKWWPVINPKSFVIIFLFVPFCLESKTSIDFARSWWQKNVKNQCAQIIASKTKIKINDATVQNNKVKTKMKNTFFSVAHTESTYRWFVLIARAHTTP